MNGLTFALALIGCVLFAYVWGLTMGYAWGRGKTALDRRIARQLDQWARVDACYECGELVAPDEGEQHGRSGWIHYRCMEEPNGDPDAIDESLIKREKRGGWA